MSQQADGLKPSDWQVEEEGHGVHYKPQEKLNTHIFLSSKNNNIVNSFHNSFIDDDLVTWLQYPLDDDSCPDIFQHWPPPPSPSPAAPGGSSTPPSASKDPPQQLKNGALTVNMAVSSTSSSVSKDPLPQEKNEALRVNIVSDDRPLTACEGNMQIDTDQTTKAPSTEVSHQEATTRQAVLEQRDGGSQQKGNLHKNEVALTATLQAGGGHGASCKHDNERESVAKDCRKPADMKLSPHEEVRSWARDAYLAVHVNKGSKHSFTEAIAVDTALDNNTAHTTQFKHSPQDERGQGLRNMDSTHLKFSAEGSSSGEKLQKEASASPPHRKEETCVQKDSSRKLSFITDSTHAVNTQTNPSAEAALALGAGRAAGVIRPSGTEAFSKVRTSLQSICPSKFSSYPSACALSPTSPSYSAGYPPPMLPPRGRAFGFRDVNLAIQPAQQYNEAKLQNAAQPQLFQPCANMCTIAPQEHHGVNPMNGGSNSNDDHSSKDSLLKSSTTALLGSQGTKGMMGSQGTKGMSVMFKQVPSTEQAKEGANVGGGRVFYGMDARDMQKLSGPPLLHREKREDFAFSGGSETSESLKEAISGTKRMLEDSECQSEDAEGGESPVNSQSRSSGSKRTRANEVHNLSERRRRNRINDKMNALRDLIPNASKSNKAALLDEAIDYLKNLQLQLQVMSLRTGVSLSPMVVPPGLPHMQTPQARPFHTVGIGTTGGSAGGIAYGVPARPLGNLTSSEPRMLQPSENSSLTAVAQSAPLNFPHSFVQAPSQPIFPMTMDMYNTYFQQQQFQQQQQQQQQLQQHLQHQEQLASPQMQAPSLPLPSSHQQSHYQL